MYWLIGYVSLSRPYLDMSIDIPEDKAREALTDVLSHVNCTIKELRRLFLIEDLVDSLKFALLLWVLTYIGSWFNGMTLIILGICYNLFSLYQKYMKLTRVQEKVPFLKKKQKAQ
ncbi:hypothetical protein KUTeg_013647 [Tegillarca granosa]|uniref:Reticulon-like protein n=1 Tax=Tegillarca granosa TaxID=220873 RepID=A0ABQ9EZQ2_TEGGR|nr:hypothetical protein KUTeg_013647 [Tegillarca granosa]